MYISTRISRGLPSWPESANSPSRACLAGGWGAGINKSAGREIAASRLAVTSKKTDLSFSLASCDCRATGRKDAARTRRTHFHARCSMIRMATPNDKKTRAGKNGGLLTKEGAAGYLAVSGRTLQKLSQPNGPIPCVRIGSGNRPILRFRVADLDRYIESCIGSQRGTGAAK